MTRKDALEAVAEAARRVTEAHFTNIYAERAKLVQALAIFDATPEDDGWQPIETAPKVGDHFPPRQRREMMRRFTSDSAHWSDCAVNRAPAYEPGPCDCGGFDARAFQAGAVAERAKIVAWLRKAAEAQRGNDPRFHAETLLNTVAAAIERGEHDWEGK